MLYTVYQPLDLKSGRSTKTWFKYVKEKAREARAKMQNIDFQGITMFYKRLNVNTNKTMAMAYLQIGGKGNYLNVLFDSNFP